MNDNNGINTYQERREAKKFVEMRLRELSISKWDIERGLGRKVPANVRNAKRLVAAYNAAIERKAKRLAGRFDRRLTPIREDLVLGRFVEALRKIKQLESVRQQIIKAGRVE